MSHARAGPGVRRAGHLLDVGGGLVRSGRSLWRLTPRSETVVPRPRLGDAFRSARVWQVSALFTFQNLADFAAAAWLPFLLARSGAAYVAWVFTCLNLLPILPLMVLPALRWAYAHIADLPRR
jgi:hypothetical protein